LLQERFGAENFDLDRLNQPAPLNDWLARLEATVPLWTGGRNKHALAAAEHRLVGGEFLHARARHEVMAEVVARYGDAVVSIHGHDAARQALQTAEAHVALARDRVETGIAVASDLLMAEVRASAAHEAVVRAENAVALARAALNLVLGRDLDTPFGLPDAFAIQPAGPADGLAQRAARAKAQRPDLAAARSHRDALTSESEAVGASRRPRLDLSVGTETHAEDPTDSTGSNTSIGLRFAIPLFDGGRTRARKRGSAARIREAEAELARFEDRIAFEVRAAFLARASAEERLRLANEAVKLALAGLTIVEDRYREGLTTLAELLDSQVALADARVRHVAGQRDLVLAGAQLALASGDLPMEP
jgi:outer membrane protein TolC